jgi:hypothetical protein
MCFEMTRNCSPSALRSTDFRIGDLTRNETELRVLDSLEEVEVHPGRGESEDDSAERLCVECGIRVVFDCGEDLQGPGLKSGGIPETEGRLRCSH